MIVTYHMVVVQRESFLEFIGDYANRTSILEFLDHQFPK